MEISTTTAHIIGVAGLLIVGLFAFGADQRQADRASFFRLTSLENEVASLRGAIIPIMTI